jgi:lactoylglutathione lyase
MKKVLFLFAVILPLLASAQKPSLNHIALYVQDIQKSTHFYQHIVGLDTIPEPFRDGKHTWLTIGNNTTLHLIGGAQETKVQDQNNHLALSVSSMETFISRLTKENIPYEDAQRKPNAVTIRPDGIKQIYFKDPDGYWIEINDARR